MSRCRIALTIIELLISMSIYKQLGPRGSRSLGLFPKNRRTNFVSKCVIAIHELGLGVEPGIALYPTNRRNNFVLKCVGASHELRLRAERVQKPGNRGCFGLFGEVVLATEGEEIPRGKCLGVGSALEVTYFLDPSLIASSLHPPPPAMDDHIRYDRR